MLKSLQAGRGLAALAVAGFHLTGLYALLPSMRGSIFAAAFRHGNTGVDFFFVLSGFIIMLAHGKDIGQPSRLRSYIRNRIVRVYPIYWFYTAVVVLAAVAGISAIGLPANTHGWFSAFSLVRTSGDRPPLSVAWTLFYEVAFYGIFGVLVASRKTGLVVMAIWLAAIAIVHARLGENSVAGVWVSLVCLNFFLGIAACWAHTRMNRPTAWVSLIGGVVALGTALAMADRGLSPAILGSSVALSCGFAIAGAASLERGRNWVLGPAAALGNASYTLYLVHVHFQSPLLKAMLRIPFVTRLNPDVIFAFVLGVTALVSYGLYLGVEKPLVQALRRAGAPRLTSTALTQAG
ncbi:MAG TPA: acyltransferase [Caulobacteraceae bacterium]|jgi:peptidoglycan/LPS O-acetylase OafA/YrhL|nr:acyltransferase [Caulobacteraceae bacterium]